MQLRLYRKIPLVAAAAFSLAGCGTGARPSPGPAPLPQLDQLAAQRGMAGDPDYIAARTVLAGMTVTQREVGILRDLRASAEQTRAAVEQMDAAELIRRARELAEQRANAQP